MPITQPSRAKRRLVVSSIAIATAVAVVAPAAAFAAVNDFGGARRIATDQTSKVRSEIKGGHAKNVIMLLGDGMGDSEITIARNYAYGAAGRLPGIDALPLTGSYTTYSLYNSGANKGKPDYVPDSAATGTAWATGTKTYDNAIGVDIDGTPHNNILELAKANGYKTGNVSTAEIQDATPAVQEAHVAARSCYGPDSSTCGADALVKGGRGSITEQLLNTRPDVTLGGGAATFSQTAKAGQWNGSTLFAQATDRGYQTVRTADELAAVTSANQKKPLLGLFADGNFPTRYLATTATVGGADTPVTCAPNPDRLASGLSLASLTNKSISLLSTKQSSTKGFFLQVEGASIDKQDHAANACGQIGETLDFDEAVQAALAFAKKDKHTLVIVTADHGHSSQIVDSTPPTSLSSAVTTVDGTTMKISWGTAAAGGSQQHTGTQVRIAGYGPQAANVVGLTDQTDLFFTMSRALGINQSLAALSRGAQSTVVNDSVAAGHTVTIKVRGFAGDRQIGATVNPGATVLPTLDAINGAATFTFTAPMAKGKYTVTLLGAQSGKKLIAKFTVK